MNSTTIICPKCQSSIPLDEVLFHDIEEKLKKKYEEDSKSQIEEIRKKSLEWKEEEKKKLAKELEEEAIKKARDLTEEETKKLRFQLDEARGQELVLRKQKNALEDNIKSWELEKQRQLDSEREKIRIETSKINYEEHHLKITEKDKQIDSMRRTIEELQIKASVTSQQLQGEALELELEEALRAEFPSDKISPVEKGIRGADVVQVVRDSMGKVCGSIIWESKRTKEWKQEWLKILKDNTLRVSGDASVLVTKVMPKDASTNFILREGVYITSFECCIELARILRDALFKISFTKTASTGKNEKMEMVYNYITSHQFTQKVSSMLEVYASMKSTLEKEKIATVKLWAQREKEIERLQLSTASIYGELQGLAGAELETTETLELPTGDNFEEVARMES